MSQRSVFCIQVFRMSMIERTKLVGLTALWAGDYIQVDKPNFPYSRGFEALPKRNQVLIRVTEKQDQMFLEWRCVAIWQH